MSPIYQTYELFLRGRDGKRSFEALTCAERGQLMPALRKLIKERQLSSVEVREFGFPLFTVGR